MYTLWIHTLPEKMVNPPVIISQSHGSSRYSWIGIFHQEEEQLLAMAEDLASKELAPWIRVRHRGTMGNQRERRDGRWDAMGMVMSVMSFWTRSWMVIFGGFCQWVDLREKNYRKPHKKIHETIDFPMKCGNFL